MNLANEIQRLNEILLDRILQNTNLSQRVADLEAEVNDLRQTENVLRDFENQIKQLDNEVNKWRSQFDGRGEELNQLRAINNDLEFKLQDRRQLEEKVR